MNGGHEAWGALDGVLRNRGLWIIEILYRGFAMVIEDYG